MATPPPSGSAWKNAVSTTRWASRPRPPRNPKTHSPAPRPRPTNTEREHRHHAVVEQVIADSKASALAHLPSGHFHANAAWLILWAMAYNLLRAAGALTSAFHAKATLRSQLVQDPARIARSARRVTLHLPRNWRWQKAWTHLFDTVHRPPEPA
ncbi:MULTISPECIES: transposase [unclassified Streptomyces]|uniref:transposase n=1 Tax=unclassified Streptomyces TaxID=2593676 RepID=UPI00081B739A|nr:hypothetical protein [Streptomyces sp. SID4936]SCE31132.1 Transposase DDE domain group 1 [Streptomyces sp. DvalAA-43]